MRVGQAGRPARERAARHRRPHHRRLPEGQQALSGEVRFPALPRRGLGVGLDLPWDGAVGFCSTAAGDALAAGTAAFIGQHSSTWSHAFFSWQPRDRSPPALDDYASAWDSLIAKLPEQLPLALHHTALNLGALGPHDRGALLEFTAALCDRYRLGWVNEDVGFWSLAGRPLPYPQPPLLTEEGLEATVRNVRACQRALPVPVVLEFPGFSRSASVVVGDLHAYEFFRRLAEATAAPVTLDVGHLLSWQWWCGKRGEALFEDIERLPLASCFEVHLSGCEIVGDELIDAHHGRLLDAQLELLGRLLERCEHLRAVTFEDPRFDASGALAADNAPSWQRLVESTRRWSTDG